jgi:hypothetical protein
MSIGHDLIKAGVDPETFDGNDLAGIDGITDWYYMLENTDNGALVALNNRIFIRPGTGYTNGVLVMLKSKDDYPVLQEYAEA